MSSIRIAADHDETPLPLEQLDPPLFAEFVGEENVITEWHDYISREMDGNRDWVEIGLPWVKWTIYRVSRAEFALLADFEGEVTIRTLNQTDNEYHIYNGKLRPVRANESAKWAADAIGGWVDAEMEIYDLEETA